MDNLIDEVLESLGSGRNVLLYGPPATGKTRLISNLFHELKQSTESSKGILLDPAATDSPFSRPIRKLPIPTPVKVEWTTFHQSYGYEDFVIGLRPEITNGGTELQPWAGLFLDAAIELSDERSEFKSVVIFIDEINRGNAARIFGEFMTFLDFDYREGGSLPLPLPLRQLGYFDGVSEEIRRMDGVKTRLNQGAPFPNHIYIVATMNSVDRAAVPIDSALARRFDRIEMRPDPETLLEMWEIERSELAIPNSDNWISSGPYSTSFYLLDRLNTRIAEDLGSEFELGHGLFSKMIKPSEAESEDESWRSLALVWDEIIFPQLEDRYSGRAEELLELLRVDTPPENGRFAWKFRTSVNGRMNARTLDPVSIHDLPVETIRRSFQWLIR